MYPKQSKTVHVETLNNELCLYDWQRKEVHALNPTVAQVWHMCDGKTSPAQMAEQIRTNLLTDLDAAQAEALVATSLAQLQNAHLIEGQLSGLKPISRREMLGWGLSALLVPVIHSILAPSPVAAQSPVPTPPTAVNDTASIATGVGTLSFDVLTNDTLGTPAATVASFGGGDLGGTVTSNAAGASVSLAGGTLTVNANGSVTLVGATTPGTYTFQYRLSNSAGHSDATVTITITGADISSCTVLPLNDTTWDLVGTAAFDGDWLRLTSATGNQGGAAICKTAFAFSSNFFVTFEYATYGGSGADGISVFFYDGAGDYVRPTLGRYGGALVYANAPMFSLPGLSNAYVGLGLDEYGNFSEPGEAGTTGPGRTPQRAVLRGSGNGTTGYKYLIGAALPGGHDIDGVDRAHARRVVVLFDAGEVTVMMDFGSGCEQILTFNVAADPDQITAPTYLRLGIGASTGADTNYHEIRGMSTCTQPPCVI